MNNSVNSENIEKVKSELDYALGDCQGAPMYLIVEIVLNVLDTAEEEGRLNAEERIEACNYITKCYGYSF